MMTRIHNSSHTSHNPLQTAILGTLFGEERGRGEERGVKNLGQPAVFTYTDWEAKLFNTEKKPDWVSWCFGIRGRVEIPGPGYIFQFSDWTIPRLGSSSPGGHKQRSCTPTAHARKVLLAFGASCGRVLIGT